MFCSWFFFFKQKTAYEMRISDWSSDVCSSDLKPAIGRRTVSHPQHHAVEIALQDHVGNATDRIGSVDGRCTVGNDLDAIYRLDRDRADVDRLRESAIRHAMAVEQCERCIRSEEHTSELQSLMRISYAVFCLKKQKKH